MPERLVPRPDEYREYFESRRPSAFGEIIHRFWNRRMLSEVLRLVPSAGEGLLLEVGPGLGFLAEACLARRMAYRAVEMNADQAAALRARGLDVAAGAIPPFPAGPKPWTIWFSHVLEHAPTYRDAHAMIAAAAAELEPGGHVVIIGPDVLSWREEFWNCDWTHGFPTSLQRVEQLLREVGLEVIVRRHHTLTLARRGLATVFAGLFRLIPVRLFDELSSAFVGRRFAYAFMVLFGWRQILVVGRKG